MKGSNKCKSCGEEYLKNGNYEFKVVKSKRIPRKARKLMEQAECSSNFENRAALSQTKFGRFLLSRARPKNIMNITCGRCSNSNQMSMKKPTPQFPKLLATPSVGNQQHLNIDLTGSASAKKKKKKNKKDLNAGLCIPPSLSSSMSHSPSSGSGIVKDTLKASLSAPPQISKISKFMLNQTKSTKAAAEKQKEMESLRKVLFKTKHNAPNSGASLKDFLSLNK